jgi:hypothetical protein
MLPKLLKQSKSTINSKFKLLGYSKATLTVDFAAQLMNLFPSMHANSQFMKQWSVRRRANDYSDDLLDFAQIELMLGNWWECDLTPDQYEHFLNV